MADGAHTRQMSLQDMVQQLKEMNAQQAELKGEIGDMFGDMFSEMKADLLGILKQALKLPEQTTVTNPNPSVETVTNPEPLVETLKNSGPFIEPLRRASVLQVPDSFCDVLLVHKLDSHVKEVEEFSHESTNGNDKIVAHQLFDQMPNEYQKDLTVISNKEVLSFSHKDDRVWEPGGLSTKMDFWDWPKGESKPHKKKSHQIETFEVLSHLEPSRRCHKESLDFVDKRMCNELAWDEDGDSIITISAKFRERYEEHQFESVSLKQTHDSVENYFGSFEYALTRSPLLHTSTDQYRAPFNPYQICSDQCHYKREFDWCVTSNMGTRILLYWRQLESFWWFVNGKEFLDTGQKMQTTLIHEEEKNRLRNIKAGITTMSRELLICLGIHNMKLKGKVEICFRTHHNLRCLITHIVLETTKLHEICSLMSLQKNADVAIPLAKETQDWIVNTWFMVQAYRTELSVAGLSQLSLASMNFGQTFDSITEPKKILSSFFRLKHKWRSRLLQSFLELKQRTIVSLWKSFGYLMEAHGSKYEGLVCVLKRKKLRNIEDDINHLKKLLATMEGLAQKISCGLLCGDSKFHLKHKWKSRLIQALYGLQFVVENGVVFTSPDKLLFPNNHKLLHPETGFCTQYNDLELLNTEHQSSPGLDYFTYLNLIWKQVFNCGCEAGHISYGFFSVGDVYGFFTCSKLQTGDETQEKRLLFLNNNNKVDHTIKENWFHSEPMIRGVYHLQRPPELIELQGNPNFITKVLVQWKEHPPDQFFSGSQWQEFNFSSLRTRMFRRGKYCDRIINQLPVLINQTSLNLSISFIYGSIIVNQVFVHQTIYVGHSTICRINQPK